MAHGDLRVLVFGASLRQGSLNVTLADLAARAAEDAGAIVDRASMHDFDARSYDADDVASGRFPDGIHEFRRRIEANDAFIWWNFVSSSRERIEQAKDDWRTGRFPAVPEETDRIPLPEPPTIS